MSRNSRWSCQLYPRFTEYHISHFSFELFCWVAVIILCHIDRKFRRYDVCRISTRTVENLGFSHQCSESGDSHSGMTLLSSHWFEMLICNFRFRCRTSSWSDVKVTIFTIAASSCRPSRNTPRLSVAGRCESGYSFLSSVTWCVMGICRS